MNQNNHHQHSYSTGTVPTTTTSTTTTSGHSAVAVRSNTVAVLQPVKGGSNHTIGTPPRPQRERSNTAGTPTHNNNNDFFNVNVQNIKASPTHYKSKSTVLLPDLEPQKLINDERMSRTVHSQKQLVELTPGSRLFEQFLVVGLSPSSLSSQTATAVPSAASRSTAAEPQILYKYPPDAPRIPDIVHFCFPVAVRLRYLRRTPSMSSIYQVLCQQVDFARSPETFLFTLTTENKETLYGICVRKDVSIDHLPSFIQTKESTNQPTKSTTMNIAPRCYCFISKFPFFKLHLEILGIILGVENVYPIPQPQPTNLSGSVSSFDLPTDKKDTRASTRNLSDVSSHRRALSLSDLPMPEDLKLKSETIVLGSSIDVNQLLSEYYKYPIPNPGQPVDIKLSQRDKPIPFSRTVIDEEGEAIKEWALAATIQALPKKQLFLAINACLLEKKVAFYSSSLRLLSSAVLSMVTLLKPFTYQAVVIPILPSKMLSLLDAPVPFILGTPVVPEFIPKDVIFFDLDRGTAFYHQNWPEFPRFKQLDDFKRMYEEFKRTLTKDDRVYTPTAKQLTFAKGIATSFSKSLLSMFDTFREHCITDMSQRKEPITIFIKESFLESVNREYLPWYQILVETQIFFHYVDNRLRKMDRAKPM